MKLVGISLIALISTSVFAQTNELKVAENPGPCYGRYVPERAEDFAWENDRIAFRVYGPRLEKQAPGSAGSGVDVWVKKVRYPIIDKWYKKGSYHRDDGEGADMYHVGLGRGCGGSAVWVDGKLFPSAHWASQRVITPGGDHVEFELTYAPWEAGGLTVSEVKRIRLEAGSNLSRVQSTFTIKGAESATIAVGIVLRGDKGELLHGGNWISYAEPMHPKNGQTYCAVVCPQGAEFKQAEGHGLLLVTVRNGETLTYYAGAGWSKGLDFKTAADWHAYVKAQSSSNSTPILAHSLAPKPVVPEPKSGVTEHKAVVTESKTVLATMQKVADWQLANPGKYNCWTRGTLYAGIMALGRMEGGQKYLDAMKAAGEAIQWRLTTVTTGGYHADGHVMGQMFCELYQICHDPAMIAPTKAQFDKILADPDTRPVGFHNRVHRQVITGIKEPEDTQPKDPKQVSKMRFWWADSLFMGPPTWMMLYKATGEKKYMDFAVQEWKATSDLLYNRKTKMFKRDVLSFRKRDAEGIEMVWARGNGWVMAGLARMLQLLPKDHPERPFFETQFRDMAHAIAKYQQEDGLWRSNMINPTLFPLGETSGSGFFTYAFAWGVNNGLLDRAKFEPIVNKAWLGLVACVEPDGKLTHVQAEGSAPGPFEPGSSVPYGVGAFLLAGSEVHKLIQKEPQLLPPGDDPLATHSLKPQISRFLEAQRGVVGFKPTGLKRADYLKSVDAQIRVMRTYQTADGDFPDVIKKRVDYACAHYAHCVATLAASGVNTDPALLESGMKAMDLATGRLAGGKKAFPCGASDFYTYATMLAFEKFQKVAPKERLEKWRKCLAAMDASKTYMCYGAGSTNWSLVHTAGEFLRWKYGLTSPDYFESILQKHRHSMTAQGLFREAGEPFSYDGFGRYFLTGILQNGYQGESLEFYREACLKGAWTSLFIQSPFGEMPTAFRSSQHIWNEAEMAAVYEMYATAYAKAGRSAEAGAFKRGARLALESIRHWIRPDGTGYIVKNRYPIEAQHGYESYSYHVNYNLLACSMLCASWQAADDSIEEKPAPADVGGYVVYMPEFHMVIANAGGDTYVQYMTQGNWDLPGMLKYAKDKSDLAIEKMIKKIKEHGSYKYNPQGLLRVHLREGHPQLGYSENLIKENAYRAPQAKLKSVTILEESAAQVRFRVELEDRAETLTLTKAGVTVAAERSPRITFPMMMFDGQTETKVVMDGKTVSLESAGRGVTFSVQEPGNAKLTRTGERLAHRNGMVEPLVVESPSGSIEYSIRPLIVK